MAVATRRSARQSAKSAKKDADSIAEIEADAVLPIDDLEAVTESVSENVPCDDISSIESNYGDEMGTPDQCENGAALGKSYPCLECGDEFDDVRELAMHEVAGHESKGLTCQVCQKVFTRKYHLERHLHLTPCSGNPPPGASLKLFACSPYALSPYFLSAHPCDVCGKVYTRRDNLREHLRVHAGEVTRRKRHQCSQCPKMFHGASLLKIHERTHTGQYFLVHVLPSDDIVVSFRGKAISGQDCHCRMSLGPYRVAV